jgi:hypothetical protein
MAWAMLPSLTRTECLRWVGTGIELVVRVLVGGAAIRPSVGAPPTTCCCRSLGSQISALTISSRGSGWPASWCRRVSPRIRALQMTASGQAAPPACRNLHSGALPRITGPVLRLAQLSDREVPLVIGAWSMVGRRALLARLRSSIQTREREFSS